MKILNGTQCKLFDGIAEDDVNNILDGLETILIPPGKSVISEHCHGDCLYIILKGTVEINKDLAENDESMVASLKVLQPGEFFGEMSLLDNEPRSANAVAKNHVELLIIPKERFFKLAINHPKIMFNLMQTLSWRLRDTNQRFIELMDKLIAQNRLMAIGMAASKIIHDIKTPLTVTVLTAQLIEKLYPETGEFTDSIVKQTQLVDQMVREILDYAKGNTTPIHSEKVNLTEFFGDIQETLSHTLSGRQVQFILQNRIKGEVFFDHFKIRRVLMNLIKNSSEAIHEKGNIRLDAALEDNELVIIVSDDGPGVSEKLKPLLFAPFQSEGKTHGTGLGLAICQKIIHEHKGTLEYIPNVPHGAIFIIKIPQAG
jgi:signal transduction histidine kinase